MLGAVTIADPDTLVAAVESGLNGVFDTGRPRVVSRAPGRLDVMGGIADTTGSRLVAATLQAGAVIAVQPADEAQFRCVVLDPRTNEIFEDVRAPLDASAGAATFDDLTGEPFSAARCSLAGILAQRASRDASVPIGDAGWTVAVWPTAPLGGGAGASAAIYVALGRAIAALRGESVNAADLVRTSRQAQFRYFNLPAGPMDAMVSLHGRANGLVQFVADASATVEPLAVPEGTRLVGIDSQKRHDRAADKYREVFVSSAMGRRIIEAILRANPHTMETPIRNLADVQPVEFVERFRDLLPTRLRGRDYVRQFGETVVDGCRIDETAVYKVRSRAEHHVYENQRVHEFIAALSRARNTGSAEALLQAGELMYSSHWSYGQRCGLGSIETDLLVNLLRERGAGGGIYGARVSGGGAGGMVTVFCAERPETIDAIDSVLDDYRTRTGLDPVVHETGGDGAIHASVRRVE